MKLSQKISLITIISLVLSLLPLPAYACSCAVPGTPLETMAEAAVVFAGEVVAIEAPGPVNGVISSADLVKITFEVDQVWKGPVQGTYTLATARDDASCGYPFKAGQSYLVYGYGHDPFQTHTCTRNALLADAAEDLSALGQGTVPPAPAPDLVPVVLTLLVVAAAGGAAGLFLYRRKRLSS